MLRKGVFSMLAFLILAPSGARAQGALGLGVIVGEPTGLSLKRWVSHRTAVDGAVAWAFHNEDALHIHLDVIFHDRSIVTSNGARIPLYYGVGGRIKFENDTRAGVRIPLGALVMLSTVPVDAFFEVVPLVDFAPDTDFTLNIAFGARFFF